MKNLLKPLKKILASLTGEEAKDKNLVTVVDKIADAVEENKESGNSMNNFLIIHTVEEDIIINNDFEEGEPQTKHILKLDKTAAELKEACENGQLIIWQNAEIYPQEELINSYNFEVEEAVGFQYKIPTISFISIANTDFVICTCELDNLPSFSALYLSEYPSVDEFGNYPYPFSEGLGGGNNDSSGGIIT